MCLQVLRVFWGRQGSVRKKGNDKEAQDGLIREGWECENRNAMQEQKHRLSVPCSHTPGSAQPPDLCSDSAPGSISQQGLVRRARQVQSKRDGQ